MFSTSSNQYRTNAVEELQRLYRERRDAIQARLLEFKQVLQRTEEEVFAELCFCLLTPQSSAKTCWDVVTRLREKNLLLNGSPQQLEPVLNNVRFNDAKSNYIVQARNMFSKQGNLTLKPHIASYYNPFELREWLVDHVKGLGYKEASHFLRNIGLGEEFAILDRHILRNIVQLGVITETPVTLTKKRYLEIEEKIRRFSKEIGIPMSDLDLLLWSKETGWIFK